MQLYVPEISLTGPEYNFVIGKVGGTLEINISRLQSSGRSRRCPCQSMTHHRPWLTFHHTESNGLGRDLEKEQSWRSGWRARPAHGMVAPLLRAFRTTDSVLPGMCLREAEVEEGKGAET